MKSVLNCDEIRRILPHRYPFLLIDRISEISIGESAIGHKNVTINEPYFQGHFPKTSIMPGVMIIESLAQLTAIVYCSRVLLSKGIKEFRELDDRNLDELSNNVGYLGKIDVKIKVPVVPGDQIVLRAKLEKTFGLLSLVFVSAHVENTLVLGGKIVVSERE